MPVTHVLIADDDALLRSLLEHKFAGAGFRVSAVEDGQAALTALVETRPDLLILDAMMPVMDGFETLRRMRQDRELSKIPVIMLTALKQENVVLNALDLGASDYLSKPFIPDELLARARRVLPRAGSADDDVLHPAAAAGH